MKHFQATETSQVAYDAALIITMSWMTEDLHQHIDFLFPSIFNLLFWVGFAIYEKYRYIFSLSAIIFPHYSHKCFNCIYLQPLLKPVVQIVG